MADDMANGNGAIDPLYARLVERVDHQGRDIVDLRSNMNTGFRNVEAAVTQLSNELRSNSKTPWPVIWSAIGVSFAIVLAVGSQALSPIRDAVGKQEAEIKDFRGDFMPRSEIEALAERGKEERDRMWTTLGRLDADRVPRGEWGERTANVNNELDAINRRIDDIQKTLGETYGVRDVIMDLKAQVERLQIQVLGGGGQRYRMPAAQ